MKETATPKTLTPEGVSTGNGQAWPLRPLTRTRRDTGALYHREEDVERQVRELSQLSERSRRAVLCEAYAPNDPRRPREETLVYFLREYHRRSDDTTAWQIAEVLIGRIAGHVQRKLARWRLPADQAEDCMHDLTTALCEAVFDGEQAAEFWEVRFWVCLDRRLWSLVEKRQATLDAEIRPGDEAQDEDGPAGGDGIFARLADTAPGPEAMAERREALALLTENERLAVYLRFIEGLPEESEDPDRESVAKILGVTGRSVRNYLRRAENKLVNWAEGKV
jgi:Predicted DNA binding protein